MRSLIQCMLIWSVMVATFGCSAEGTVRAATGPVSRSIVIPSRTLLKVMLIDGLDSKTSSGGDTFRASLAEPVVVNGATILDTGTILSGIVLNSLESGLMSGNASIEFELTGIQQGDHIVAISTNSFSVTGAVNQKRNSEVVAGSAGLRGTGSGFAFPGKGKDIHYGPATRLNFTLTHSVQL